MKKTRLVVAVALAAFVPSTAAAGHRVARFNVTLTARQTVSWTEDLTLHGCGGGVFRTQGHGSSTIRLRSKGAPRVVAKFVRGRGIVLTPPMLAVRGTLKRDGVDSAIVIEPGTPGACPPPEAIPRDCGTRRYPVDSQIGITVEPWLDPKNRINGDVIQLTGPTSREWLTGPPFLNCLAMGRDDMLAGPAMAGDPPRAVLLDDKLFGKRRRFVVKAERTQTVDHMKAITSPTISGTRPTTTTTSWRLAFSRISHRRR